MKMALLKVLKNKFSVFWHPKILKRLLIILFSMSMVFCYSPNRSCETYRTGNFEFTEMLNGKSVTTIFSRNDSLEIAHFQGKTDTSAVRWINPCEYIIKKIHPHSNAEKQSIHIKILSTTDSSYIFEYSSVGSSYKKRGIAKKIK